LLHPRPAQTPGGGPWPPSEKPYTLRERGLVQYVWEAEVVSWAGLLKKGLVPKRLNPPLPLRSKPSLLHVSIS